MPIDHLKVLFGGASTAIAPDALSGVGDYTAQTSVLTGEEGLRTYRSEFFRIKKHLKGLEVAGSLHKAWDAVGSNSSDFMISDCVKAIPLFCADHDSEAQHGLVQHIEWGVNINTGALGTAIDIIEAAHSYRTFQAKNALFQDASFTIF